MTAPSGDFLHTTAITPRIRITFRINQVVIGTVITKFELFFSLTSTAVDLIFQGNLKLGLYRDFVVEVVLSECPWPASLESAVTETDSLSPYPLWQLIDFFSRRCDISSILLALSSRWYGMTESDRDRLLLRTNVENSTAPESECCRDDLAE